MKIAIGSDHRGYDVKRRVITVLEKLGHEVLDVGPQKRESVDYPDYAERVARAVAAGAARFGILVCGTGIGMSIAANKVKGVRAALCTTELEARMARAHNDANVLCLGERVVGSGLGAAIVDAFLATPFEAGRHARRVEKIAALEK